MRLVHPAYARLAERPIIRTLDFAISVPGVRQADRQIGRSLAAVLEAPLPDGINVLRIKMQAAQKRGDSLDRGFVMDIVDNLRNLGGDVSRLLVKAKAENNTKADEIDLLEDRLVVDINLELGPDRRYPQDGRWEILHGQLDNWLNGGELPV